MNKSWFVIFVLLAMPVLLVACDTEGRLTEQASISGAGLQIDLTIDDLVIVSDLVVRGTAGEATVIERSVQVEFESSTAALRNKPGTVDFYQVDFQVFSYIKGSGPETITVTLPGPTSGGSSDDLSPQSPALGTGNQYVLFLFEPTGEGAKEIYGDSYLTQGPGGRWAVSTDATPMAQSELPGRNSIPVDDLVSRISETLR